MANEIKKYIRIPAEMNDYIRFLAQRMNISENDAIKMIIFNDMKSSRYLEFMKG